ncbi:hypothetical protein DICSQDRAFT_98647 [Dichomitus squalens LYAD-421 SS1]|uniref:uncharacterized protein n=1 Tax=Dichomitus squalens (strain LYAD-421) TaxID=732165 RepID=UPI0004413E3C|nr:uncharacterized protein DICSQDRAFT_98647 [Dichomitus squalens LYAD-421 SS1]EJF65107.1 hypothetical protein DICSQDRAFT_98647 [Dichomitus squalens LYAD-421 SS1]
MLTASRRALRSTLDACLSPWGLLDWLRLLWCITVLWYELASFAWSLRACSWPDALLSPVRRSSRERPAHILLVADPQVRELSTSRAAGFAAVRLHLTELALRRNWFFASRRNPDVVVFLGDILASWRLIRSDEDYRRNYDKFVDIFRSDRRIPSYFVPGNNDVGLNIDPSAAREARRRFTTHFGPLNHKIHVHNHTLVMLDAAGLVEEDYLRAAKYIDYDHWSPLPHGPVEFVHSLREESERYPDILFTHIPLHRPETASCGPLREKGSIRRGVGPNYQNMLDKKTTTFLLQSITPEIVFSADDKDYCDYVHVPPRAVIKAVDGDSQEANDAQHPVVQNVREITIKAFSPSPEIRHPGFQLLSLAPPSSADHFEPSLATTPCFLPDYPSAYTWRYIPLFFVTTLVLVLLRRKQRSPSLPTHRQSIFRRSISLSTLPPVPWTPLPHPSTPFSSDWSPSTPGFFTPRPRSPHSAKSIPSPTEEFPRGSLRAPLLSARTSNGDAEPLQTTPTLRATAHSDPDAGGSSQHLPTGPTHIEADELEDDFAYGLQRHAQPLRYKIDRGDEPLGVVSDGLGITFTLNGQRRRISLWNPLKWRQRRRIPSGGGVGARRRSGKRAFLKRVVMDLGYIVWPAALLWLGLRWLMA